MKKLCIITIFLFFLSRLVCSVLKLQQLLMALSTKGLQKLRSMAPDTALQTNITNGFQIETKLIL